MKTSLAAALAAIPKADQPHAETFRHGTMKLSLFAPRSCADQPPTAHDQLYLVVTGRGEFVRGNQRTTFEPGDVLFAPAGAAHRFEHFADNFTAWIVADGRAGGESDQVPGRPVRQGRKRKTEDDDGVRSIRIIRTNEAA